MSQITKVCLLILFLAILVIVPYTSYASQQPTDQETYEANYCGTILAGRFSNRATRPIYVWGDNWDGNTIYRYVYTNQTAESWGICDADFFRVPSSVQEALVGAGTMWLSYGPNADVKIGGNLVTCYDAGSPNNLICFLGLPPY